jgi:hypothetical protein
VNILPSVESDIIWDCPQAIYVITAGMINYFGAEKSGRLSLFATESSSTILLSFGENAY